MVKKIQIIYGYLVIFVFNKIITTLLLSFITVNSLVIQFFLAFVFIKYFNIIPHQNRTNYPFAFQVIYRDQ